MQLVVEASGTIRCLYDETISLASLGQLSIHRGSHVEPDEQGRWLADLSPVHGPVLGPFADRSEALSAERDWLQSNWLLTAKRSMTAVTSGNAGLFTIGREPSDRC